MDLNILFADPTKKVFTDANLTLTDNNVSINISVHKFILASASKYFNGLFTFGNNCNKTNFKIIVDDATIAHDLILSWYGQKINSATYPAWMHLLKTFKCKSFFLCG